MKSLARGHLVSNTGDTVEGLSTMGGRLNNND